MSASSLISSRMVFEHKTEKSEKMKKLLAILCIFSGLIIISCEPFSETPLERLTNETVFSSGLNTEYFLNNIYNSLPGGYNRIDNAMLASASDEAHHSVSTSTIHYFNRGTLTSANHPDQRWNDNFAGIRKTFIFTENVKLSPIDSATKSRFTGEALFLRAFFYFELLKRYGGVPLLTRSYSTTDDFKAIPRAKYEDCVNYIVELCDEALTRLPATLIANQLGRPSKGACLALKSRVLLYAASPLFNTNTPAGDDPDFLIHSAFNAARWADAAEAAKAAIDFGEAGPVYTLMTKYEDIFLVPAGNQELIFVKNDYTNKNVELMNYPTGYSPGQGLTCPTQSMIDAYEMKNGEPIFLNDDPTTPNPASGYNPANPYVNRDNRFALSILYSGCPNLQSRTVETWTGGKDMLNATNSTKTGYYIRKFLANINIAQGSATSYHVFPLIRFAEMYLNYAEAKNEALAAPDASVYDALNKIRQRAGQPLLVAGSLTKDEMRVRIKRERRVELAFEEHRLFDLRRWRDAETVLSKPVTGITITKSGSVYTYERKDVETRLFLSPRMYYYPIPQQEVNKTGYRQNTGWEM
jgi:hypothetical protein